MIVSYNWLKELVKLNVSAEKLAEEMSLYSVEVESFKKLIDATNLVVGLVTSKKKHENSDHLNVCMVNFGDYELQIVCGAPNVEVGQKVIVALPDAVLPGGIIKKSTIRGIESNGMICSLQELGLESKYIPSEYAHGIYVLKDDAKVGSNALEYLCLDDYAIELGLTPNRMDLLSMLGVANDVKAMYHSECIPLKYEFHEIDKLTSDQIQVTLNTKNCYSYYARVIEDVTIKESPNFIKARLIASGIRPINNVVDITNYVLSFLVNHFIRLIKINLVIILLLEEQKMEKKQLLLMVLKERLTIVILSLQMGKNQYVLRALWDLKIRRLPL